MKLKKKFILNICIFIFLYLSYKFFTIKNAKKYVVISSNLDKNKPYYYFYLPIIAEAWRRIDFEPVFLIVSSDFENINEQASKSIEYLKKLNCKIKFLQSDPSYEVMTSMISRLFVGIFPNELISDDDFVLTTDADLIPISKSYYDFNQDHSSIKIWNAYCCNDTEIEFNNEIYRMFPISHVGMTKTHWRGVMGLNFQNYKLDTDSVFKKINEIFENNKTLIQKNENIFLGDTTWYLDQKILSIKIHEYVFRLKRASLDLKPYEGMRLNRFYKNIKNELIFLNENDFSTFMRLNFSQLTDFHAFHNFNYNNWDLFKKLIERVFDFEETEFFSKYFNEFNSLN